MGLSNARLARMERFVNEKNDPDKCEVCGGRVGASGIVMEEEWTVAADGNSWAGPPKITEHRDDSRFNANYCCRRCGRNVGCVTIQQVALGDDDATERE